MTLRTFLDLFAGVPLDTIVLFDGGNEPRSINYVAEGHAVIVLTEDDEYNDYFTDEDEEDDDDGSSARS